MGDQTEELQVTPLNALHRELGGRMVGFAGYDMPVQFDGIMAEHKHTREAAGLFDVSHMGQVLLTGDGADAALEALVPSNMRELKPGRQRYSFFTNDDGGILDDLMVANRGDHLFVVVNAACKEADIAHMRTHMADNCDIEEITDRALLALQGPGAEAAIAGLVPDVAAMKFMDVITADSAFGPLWISRSGYTGEDGYEVSVEGAQAQGFARALLAAEGVAPIGLGARDSLRLEAGLCLYGNDIDETTTPVEAALVWGMQKARKPGGAREGGFPGAARILRELTEGATRQRVGLRPEGRAPMRAGTLLFADDTSEAPIGTVTSGAYGPTIEAPMSMGYVPAGQAAAGTVIFGEVRGKRLPVVVTEMPFKPATYKR